MAFEPDKWADGEEGGTPITAAELNRIEASGAAKAQRGEKGEKGDPGAEGARGPAGADGAAGADGFGTEVQYDDLVARVTALEGGA